MSRRFSVSNSGATCVPNASSWTSPFSAADALTRVADPIEQTLMLILSDINMPGMTGLEMLPKVREMRPDVPIIMITAYGDPETKRKAIEGGATGLLTKPIDFTLLREEIDTRLGMVGS